MNYSMMAKNEIVKLGFSTDCCKLAFLSAVIHTAGSVLIRDKKLEVEIFSENVKLLEKVGAIIKEFYSAEPSYGKRKISLVGDRAMAVMYDCGLFVTDGGHTVVEEGINASLIQSPCCKVNYIRGAFLGAGSLSAGNGYHLEFGVSNPVFAEHLAALLENSGVPAKIIAREKKVVVYAKGSEAVCDCLALMGASGAVLKLNDELVLRDARKNYNRINNCEYANIGKTVDAAVKQSEAIKFIKKKAGLASLSDKLSAVAVLRLENPEASLSELASIIGLPKSTVKNRLNKIVEIAENLKEKTDG